MALNAAEKAWISNTCVEQVVHFSWSGENVQKWTISHGSLECAGSAGTERWYSFFWAVLVWQMKRAIVAALVILTAGGGSFLAALMAPSWVGLWVKQLWLKLCPSCSTVGAWDGQIRASSHTPTWVAVPAGGAWPGTVRRLSCHCHQAQGAHHEFIATFCIVCRASPASLCLWVTWEVLMYPSVQEDVGACWLVRDIFSSVFSRAEDRMCLLVQV